jgi:sarcosine oxidase subunit beta
MSPDDHVILGPTAVAGVNAASGSCGHGLMHAPAIGQLVAELIVDGAASSLNIAALGPDRFARGALLSGPALF